MGVAEEGTKVVGGFISALGSQPVLLVQSAIIAGVVFILYAQGSKAFDERKELLQSIFESQKNVREILSQCIVPQRPQGGYIPGSNLLYPPPSAPQKGFKLQSIDSEDHAKENSDGETSRIQSSPKRDSK